MESKTPVHIFVVENDRIFIRLLDFVFDQDLRFRFLDFKSGEDSLRNLSILPQLIVLDYRLPGMNGIETMLEIREQMPDVHIIMLSSVADGKLPVEFLNAGANEHILKDGTEFDRLCERIRVFIKTVDQPQPKATGFQSVRRKVCYALIVIALIASAGYYFYH